MKSIVPPSRFDYKISGALIVIIVSVVAVIPAYLYIAGIANYNDAPTPPPAFTWNDAPFRPVGFNYFPSTHPWIEMWTAFNRTEMDQDLQRVKSLGGNCIRTFLQWQLVEPVEGEFNRTIINRVVDFFEACSDAGVAVMFSFFDGPLPSWTSMTNDDKFTDPLLIEREITQLQVIIPLVKEKTSAFMWDLMNEPKSDVVTREQFRAWVETMTVTIREIDNEHLIVVGGGFLNFENPAFYADLVDVICVHFYWNMFSPSWRQDLVNYLQLFIAIGKPVILQEFGLPTTGDDGFTEDDQAIHYRTIFEVCDENGIDGIMPWCLWDYKPVLWMERERHFGVLRLDGSWKPAAFEFHDYATS